MTLPGLVAANNLSDVVDRERAWDNLGFNVSVDYSTAPAGLFPGAPLAGGFFAGYISHTADGVPTHALIVAPRATGATGAGYAVTTALQYKTSNTDTPNAYSSFDGAANTVAIIEAGINSHPAAKFCIERNIGGFNDWYLPAPFELDIAYFNLKPTASANATSIGINQYSVPPRTVNYSELDPGQTFRQNFNAPLEAFVAGDHWSSRAATGSAAALQNAVSISFATGSGSSVNKGNSSNLRVRAFRKLSL